jgi:hypothetical protein
MDFGAGAGEARCALHPEQRAAGACERCGNFMCSTCSEGGTQNWCPTCRERTGHGTFPLRRDTWSFSALWDYCFESFKREWLMLSLAALVVMAITGGAQFVSSLLPAIGTVTESVPLTLFLQVLSFVVQTMVQGVMTLGLFRVCFDVLEGRRADVGRIFSQLHKVWRYVAASLTTMVLVGVPLVLIWGVLALIGLLASGVSPATFLNGEEAFRQHGMLLVTIIFAALGVSLVPILYIALPLYLLQAEFTFNDEVAPMTAIRNCFTLAQGQRWSILGVALVMVLVLIVGMLACCISLLPAMGLGHLLIAGLYLSLRQGSSLDQRPR